MRQESETNFPWHRLCTHHRIHLVSKVRRFRKMVSQNQVIRTKKSHKSRAEQVGQRQVTGVWPVASTTRSLGEATRRQTNLNCIYQPFCKHLRNKARSTPFQKQIDSEHLDSLSGVSKDNEKGTHTHNVYRLIWCRNCKNFVKIRTNEKLLKICEPPQISMKLENRPRRNCREIYFTL